MRQWGLIITERGENRAKRVLKQRNRQCQVKRTQSAHNTTTAVLDFEKTKHPFAMMPSAERTKPNNTHTQLLLAVREKAGCKLCVQWDSG